MELTNGLYLDQIIFQFGANFGSLVGESEMKNNIMALLYSCVFDVYIFGIHIYEVNRKIVEKNVGVGYQEKRC